eukprot:m.188193 g.188193  ORF g.188193 m.188193 type:complete len:149 (-) comp53594_c1_seq18:5-451(-)
MSRNNARRAQSTTKKLPAEAARWHYVSLQNHLARAIFDSLRKLEPDSFANTLDLIQSQGWLTEASRDSIARAYWAPEVSVQAQQMLTHPTAAKPPQNFLAELPKCFELLAVRLLTKPTFSHLKYLLSDSLFASTRLPSHKLSPRLSLR